MTVTDPGPVKTRQRIGSFLLKDGRLRPIYRLVLFPPLLILSFSLPNFLLRTLFALRQVPGEESDTLSGLFLYTLTHAVVVACILIFTRWWLRWVDGRDMDSLGYARSPGWRRALLSGLALGAGITALLFAIQVLSGWLLLRGFAWDIQPTAIIAIDMYRGLLAALTSALYIVTLVPGYLLQTIEYYVHTPLAVVTIAAVAGFERTIKPIGEGWGSFVLPYTVFVSLIMLCTAFARRRSLWMPLGLYAGTQIFGYLVFALNGTPADGATLIATRLAGPVGWVGLPIPQYGFEVGGLYLIICLVVTGALVTDIIRRRRIS